MCLWSVYRKFAQASLFFVDQWRSMLPLRCRKSKILMWGTLCFSVWGLRFFTGQIEVVLQLQSYKCLSAWILTGVTLAQPCNSLRLYTDISPLIERCFSWSERLSTLAFAAVWPSEVHLAQRGLMETLDEQLNFWYRCHISNLILLNCVLSNSLSGFIYLNYIEPECLQGNACWMYLWCWITGLDVNLMTWWCVVKVFPED